MNEPQPNLTSRPDSTRWGLFFAFAPARSHPPRRADSAPGAPIGPRQNASDPPPLPEDQVAPRKPPAPTPPSPPRPWTAPPPRRRPFHDEDPFSPLSSSRSSPDRSVPFRGAQPPLIRGWPLSACPSSTRRPPEPRGSSASGRGPVGRSPRSSSLGRRGRGGGRLSPAGSRLLAFWSPAPSSSPGRRPP